MGDKMKKIKVKLKKIKKKISKQLSLITEKLNLKEKKFNALELGLIIIMTLVFGILIGEISFSHGKIYQTSSNLSEIEKVYNTLVNEYYGEVSGKNLKEAAIDGMMKLLGDQYSAYLDEETTEDFNEKLNGTFVGIGAEVTNTTDGFPIVVTVYENTPADKAGLKSGDIFKKLNEEDVSTMHVNDLVAKIKGSTKTVKLTMEREKEEFETTLVTGKVDIPSVTSLIFEKETKKIGYISLSIFALNTDEQFKTELEKMNKENIKDIIIDVRDNSGGHLETVVNIASLFLNKNQPICQIQTKEETTKIYSSQDNDTKYNIVVLANQNSASASELLAAALNEQYNAKIVGTKTYGKGTVQKTLTLNDGSMIKYTAETWLTSKGNTIDQVGISPTIEELLSEDYYKNPTSETDNQLQKAIEILNK